MNFDLYGILIAKYSGKMNLIGVLEGIESNPNYFCTDFLTRSSILEQLKNNGVLFKVDSIEDSVIINLIDYSRAKDNNGEEYFIVDLTNVLDQMLSLEKLSEGLLGDIQEQLVEVSQKALDSYYSYLTKNPKLNYDLSNFQITQSAKSLLDKLVLSDDYSMAGSDSNVLNAEDRMYKALSNYKEILFANDMAESRTSEYDSMFDDYPVVFHPDYSPIDFKGCIEELPDSLKRYTDYITFNKELQLNRIPESILEQLVGKSNATEKDFVLHDNEKEFYESICKYIDFECDHIKEEKKSEVVSGKDFLDYGILYKYLNYIIFCVLRDNWGHVGVYAPSLQSNSTIVSYAAECRSADRNNTAYPSDKANMVNEHNSNELDYLYDEEQKTISLVGNSNFEEAVKAEVISDVYFQAKAIIAILRSGERRMERLYLPMSDKEFVFYKGNITSIRNYSNYEPIVDSDNKVYELDSLVNTNMTFDDPNYCSQYGISSGNFTIPALGTSMSLMGMKFKLDKKFEDDIQSFTEFMSIFDIAEILDKKGYSPIRGLEFDGDKISLTKEAYDLNELTITGILKELNDRPALTKLYVSDSVKDFYMCISSPGKTKSQLEVLDSAQSYSNLAVLSSETKNKNAHELRDLVLNGRDASLIAYSRYLETGYLKYISIIPKYIKEFVNDAIDYNELIENLLNTAYLVYVQYIKQNSLLLAKGGSGSRFSIGGNVEKSNSFSFAKHLKSSEPVSVDPMQRLVREVQTNNIATTIQLLCKIDEKPVFTGFYAIQYTDKSISIIRDVNIIGKPTQRSWDTAIVNGIKQQINNPNISPKIFFDSLNTANLYKEYLKKVQ